LPTNCELRLKRAKTSLENIKKKNKNVNIKPFQVKSYMWIFINALIENPAFDSQTKETLTLKSSAFGSKCEIKEEFIKKGMPSSMCS
jgi:DNA topoisomerase-2